MSCASCDEHRLERDGQSAVVTERGAGLRSWRVAGEELLDGFGAGEPCPDFRGLVLAPWPNRLRDGRYRFGGVEHRTPVTEPERRCALHGLVLGERWHAVRGAPDRLMSRCVVRPRPGYPFTVGLEVEHALTAGGLRVSLRARNLGGQSAPFGAGFHPYLRVRDGAALEVPAAQRLPVDERLLPAGPPVPLAGTQLDLRRPRPVAALTLDTTYGALARDGDGLARVRLGGVTVWLDAGFPYVHVYTADAVTDPARRRGGVAIEPMTCAPDAFNSGDGLAILPPGGSLSARWGMCADAVAPPTRREQ